LGIYEVNLSVNVFRAKDVAATRMFHQHNSSATWSSRFESALDISSTTLDD
jgi:hypothetical protein